MHSKCDILILTAKFGNGHIVVSHTIKEYINMKDPNIKCNIVDLYEIINPHSYKRIYKGYELLVKNGYKLYNMYYNRKNHSQRLLKMDTASKTSLIRFGDYISDVNPSMIISTFPICTGYASKYKSTYKSNVPLITCITDVVDSNEWIYEKNNLYFVATEEIQSKLIDKGICKNRIAITGIPIRKRFINDMNKDKLRLEYGFNKKDFIILMMGGGLGILPDEFEFYNCMNEYDNVKIVVVTGNNKSLYNRLCKVQKKINCVKLVQYTENIPELMNISDLLISKAGGITLFEAIASKLPLIVYKPLLGQEKENCRFVQNESIGYIAYTPIELKILINEVIKNSSKKEMLLQSLDCLGKNIHMDLMVDKILQRYYGYNCFYKIERSSIL
jgi:UDP-N-acetylglucosamine:LPS N-acetylglucosamine transferase